MINFDEMRTRISPFFRKYTFSSYKEYIEELKDKSENENKENGPE